MVLTLLPNGIDLLLTEKQSMAQIVCNELAQLTWQSSSDLFVFRLTHLRDLSESWRQFDVSKSLTPLVANNTIEQPIVRAINKAGMLTRSKSISKSKSVPLSVTKGETTTRSKLNDSGRKSNSRSFKSIPRSSESASKENTNDVDMTSLVENTAHTDVSELTQNDEDEASTKVLNQSSESVDGLSTESNIHVKYSCAKCESSFSLLRSLKRHMKAAHTEAEVSSSDASSSGAVECKACGSRFKNKHKLRVHRSTHGSCRAKFLARLSLEDVQCRDCGLVCANKYKLRVHRSKTGACRAERAAVVRRSVPSAQADGGGTCSVCERTFSLKLSLVKHLREHRLQDAAMTATVAWIRQDEKAAQEIVQTDTFPCTECEASFSSIDAVCWHVRIHSDRSHWQSNKLLALQSGDFKCTVCDRQFHSEVEYHVHCAENEEAHECLECGRRIKSALHLRIHRLVHRQQDRTSRRAVRHGTGSGRYQRSPKKLMLHPCPICSRVFKHAIHLDIHMTMHTGVKNFVCHICAKQFATKGQLKRHIMIHEGKPSFDCAHCHKRFLLRDTLQRHVRVVHDKERRHLCSLCGWPFAEKHQLRKHMKVHSINSEMVQFIVVNE